MNAIDPEEMAGDYVDYQQHATPSLVPASVPTPNLAAEQKHAALVTAFEALAAEFGRDGSHYHRDRVLAVLKENS